MNSRHILSLVVLIVFLSVVAADSNECVYTLYVKTGSIMKAGTDSIISATLGDATGKSVWIPKLKDWGLMGPNHDYFERGNVDIFTGLAPCIGKPICLLNLTSDGSGDHHGWYCDYVELTSSAPHRSCSQSTFYVNQWLAKDVPPYQLSACVDGCKVQKGGFRTGGKGNFVIRNKRHPVLFG